MQLKLITYDVCPTCGAETAKEECSHTHCNGQGFEIREFRCGAIFEWSPNFERLEQKKLCSQDPKVIEFMAKRRAANRAIVDFIAELNVDEEYKKDVIRRF